MGLKVENQRVGGFRLAGSVPSGAGGVEPGQGGRDPQSGYARLDDAEIVRMEVEWREAPAGRRLPIPELVDRYLRTLEKKAQKSDVSFTVRRRAKFLKDKRWLENSEYETFVWEADYRAYNLARACGECGRIVLLRGSGEAGREPRGSGGERSSRPFGTTLTRVVNTGAYTGSPSKSRTTTPSSATSSNRATFQLTFEKKNHECRIQRLSMAQMLLKGTTLPEWYPRFFRKQLRDFNCEIEESEEAAPGHGGLRVMGKPRSRWRQILRPLPLVNTRPRRHLDGRVWHCVEGKQDLHRRASLRQEGRTRRRHATSD